MPRYLVTSALPYANGPSHLGQVAGAYLPADIFVRFLRLCGEDVVYICGTDEHGKPITKRAIAEGVSPQVIVDRYHEQIKDEFARLRIEFDNFSGTARPAHAELSQKFFLDLLSNGYLREQSEEIFWCETCNLSLADRDVEGTCPKCKDHIARGDECKKSGSWLQATDLIDPVCSVCGNPPIRRETRSWFLDLPELTSEIEAWLDTKTWWKDNVVSFVRAWIRDGLRLRSVTRDMPWGVPVPIDGVEDKVLYVWLDAPIGYISSTIEWAERIGDPERWKRYWLDEDSRLVHFIGKDNIPFHAVTWPATLIGRNEGKDATDRFILPYDVPANEYLTLEGEPFATGRNWAVWTGEALDVVPADVIRYCLAANAPENKDADFSWSELRDRNNTDLADTYGNLASRTLRFIQKYFDGVVPALVEPSALDLDTLGELEAAPERIGALFRAYKVRAASSAIMDVARLGNRYYDAAAPWQSRKTDLQAAGNCMHVCVRILRALATLSWPVIPTSAEALLCQLGEQSSPLERGWDRAAAADPPLAGRRLGAVEILFKKLDDDFVEEQVRRLKGATVTEASSTAASAGAPEGGKPEAGQEEKSKEITYDDFARLDIRVGVVLSAERIPKADKLLKLQIDLGDEQRQVLAGVAEWYTPEELVGKRVPILTNLAPRKIRGEISQGMMLAADGAGGAAVILQPQGDIAAGSKVPVAVPALALVVLLALAAAVPAQAQPDGTAPPHDAATRLVTVTLLASSDAGFGAAAESELEGRIREKHPYRLVLETNPDPDSTWTAVLEFAGRDIVSIDGVAFADVPNTSDPGRTWVLTRRLAVLHEGEVSAGDGSSRGERVLSGRAITHFDGLEVRQDSGPPEQFSWLEVRGVDGLQVPEWLQRRGDGGASTWLPHPRTRWVDPILHSDARRLRLLWSDDSFAVLLFLLVVAALIVAVPGSVVSMLAGRREEPRPRGLGASTLATGAAGAIALAALGVCSRLDGGRPWVEIGSILTTVCCYAAGYALVSRVRGRSLAVQLVAAALAAFATVGAAHVWGIPGLESWMAR